MLWWLLTILCFILILDPGNFATTDFEFTAIKPGDEAPAELFPNNTKYVSDRLRINIFENDVFLTIIKSKEIPFSLYFKNNEASKNCQSNFLLTFGGYPSITVVLSCQERYSELIVNDEREGNIIYLSNDEKIYCFTNVTMNSNYVKIFNETKTKEQKIQKFEIEEQQILDKNNSIISMVISVAIKQDDDSMCQPYIELGAEHYLAAFQEVPEIITTTSTTTTTTKKPTTVYQTTKPPTYVMETSKNGPILWILIFVFSGTFAAAFGGVAMFFFLRWRQRRAEKKQLLGISDEELHTAKEKLQTPPRSVKTPSIAAVTATAPPPSKTTSTATPTAKKPTSSQPSKIQPLKK